MMRGIMLGAALVVASALPSVRATITQKPGTAVGETVLVVRLIATDMALGSYQGVLRYTPGTLAIVSGAAPRGDGTRMLNLADSAKGVIRYAGFTVSGFAGDTVLTLVVRAPRGIDAATLSAVPDVAGDISGISVPRDRLIPARGVTADPSRH
jgi:hypothetical protein